MAYESYIYSNSIRTGHVKATLIATATGTGHKIATSAAKAGEGHRIAAFKGIATASMTGHVTASLAVTGQGI
jgi:hypothetical protein